MAHARSDPVSKGLEARRDSCSQKDVDPLRQTGKSPSKGLEQPPRRGYQGLSARNTLFALFLLCSCVFLLVRDVRYAPLALRMFQEDQAAAAPWGLPLIPHNAPHQVVEKKSSQEFEAGNLQNSPPADEALPDINLSAEENLTVEEEFGAPNFATSDERPSPARQYRDTDNAEIQTDATKLNPSGSEFSDAPVDVTNPEDQPVSETGVSKAKLTQIDATELDLSGSNGTEWDFPRAIPRDWKPSKKCATAEEMGKETSGGTRAASLRVRAMIQDFIAQHGARRVRNLKGAEFCQQRFVMGESVEDGFGNNMYKVLTAAGLSVMLNRSLIIAERGSTVITYARRNPGRKPAFGDYLDFTDEAFSMREVRRLWAINECVTKHKRDLVVHSDSLQRGFRRTSCICDDWTKLTAPILHFRGAVGSGAIQLLLKNAHAAMRRAAAKLLGNPAIPSSRPNTFGELFRAFVSPNADIQEAVQWALAGGPDPDITLHLRMLHSRSRPGPAAAASCINRICRTLSPDLLTSGRRPRIVVVTDTPAIIPDLRKALGQSMEVIRFDYLAYVKQSTNRSEVLSLNYGVPKSTFRRRDWGEMPRWVAMVDFFLAARARSAVVSGAYRRVSTTYAQLVAALANAYTLESESPCVYYSSLQANLLKSGLATQSGWGHTWRPFGGRLGCRKQAPQCALTALLPYSWWDAPWQSPIDSDVSILKGVAGIDAQGQISEHRMDLFCDEARRHGHLPRTTLQIPSLDDAIAEQGSL